MSSTRLLDIAIREFGAKGLEGASTRGIAAAAGTAMSAITYHYGGKEGLYLAAADRIAMLMGEMAGEDLAAVAAAAMGNPIAAREAALRILMRMADTMASPDSEAWVLFVVREQTHPTAAFDRIYAGSLGTMVGALAQLVQVATGASTAVAGIATITLVGQAIALRASRAMVLRLLETDTLRDDDLVSLKARITVNTHVILDRLAAETGDLP